MGLLASSIFSHALPTVDESVLLAPYIFFHFCFFLSWWGAQVLKDWNEVHLPLVEAHPEVLGGLTFEARANHNSIGSVDLFFFFFRISIVLAMANTQQYESRLLTNRHVI